MHSCIQPVNERFAQSVMTSSPLHHSPGSIMRSMGDGGRQDTPVPDFNHMKDETPGAGEVATCVGHSYINNDAEHLPHVQICLQMQLHDR